MATIYEVSELAGVSLATVSRVMNASGKVSARTREKVEAAMKAGVDCIKSKGLLCKEVTLPQPHPDIRQFFL